MLSRAGLLVPTSCFGLGLGGGYGQRENNPDQAQPFLSPSVPGLSSHPGSHGDLAKHRRRHFVY